MVTDYFFVYSYFFQCEEKKEKKFWETEIIGNRRKKLFNRSARLFSTWFFASSLISNKTNCPTYLATYLDYFFQRLPYPLKYKKKNGPVSKTFDFQSLFCNLLSCPYKVKDKNRSVCIIVGMKMIVI